MRVRPTTALVCLRGTGSRAVMPGHGVRGSFLCCLAPLSHPLPQLKDGLARTQLCDRPGHSAAVPRRLTSLSFGSVTRMISDTSRPPASAPARPGRRRAPRALPAALEGRRVEQRHPQRCHGPRHPLSARAHRRRLPHDLHMANSALLSMTHDPAAVLRYPSIWRVRSADCGDVLRARSGRPGAASVTPGWSSTARFGGHLWSRCDEFPDRCGSPFVTPLASDPTMGSVRGTYESDGERRDA
jgi:hypothetical protein